MSETRHSIFHFPLNSNSDIGGITQADVPALLDTGIDGIAVSGAISRTDNPIEATRLFLALLSPTAQP